MITRYTYSVLLSEYLTITYAEGQGQGHLPVLGLKCPPGFEIAVSKWNGARTFAPDIPAINHASIRLNKPETKKYM